MRWPEVRSDEFQWKGLQQVQASSQDVFELLGGRQVVVEEVKPGYPCCKIRPICRKAGDWTISACICSPDERGAVPSA